MSQNTGTDASQQELRDFYESGGGAPVVSWKTSRIGDVFKGVFVPVNPEGDVHRTSQQTNTQNEPLTFDDGSPRTQAEHTLVTPYRNFEFMSEDAVERIKSTNPNATDDGVRRLFVKGGSMPKEMKKALRQRGASKPEIGGSIAITLVRRDNNSFGGKTGVFECSYEKSTPATQKVVNAYLDSLDGEDSNEVVGTAVDHGTEDPPF